MPLQDAFHLFPKFKYFFDIRGIETVELDNSPKEWASTTIEYDRSKTFNSIRRPLTFPYTWVRKAARICRGEYANYSLMARIHQRIMLGDGRNNYSEVYNGKLDFSTKVDTQDGFQVVSNSADFTSNIDAYGDQLYSFSLEDGKYVELTPIKLTETASLLPGLPPDGKIHSDYFPPIDVVNNQINSIDPTVFSVPYAQTRDPDFSNSGECFFYSRTDGNLYITGALEVYPINFGGGTRQMSLYICDINGTEKYSIIDRFFPAGYGQKETIELNATIPLVKGEQLFFYMKLYQDEQPNVGILITAGQLDLSYQTVTPATMCKGLTLDQIFAKLLQAMNTNENTGPNLPMPYQSFLLNTVLKDIVVTSSDSIRASQGSIYHSGDTLFQGVYKVLTGTVNYGGNNYNTGQQFTYTPANASFSGSGVVEKVTAIYNGVTYNPGDTLQAGGTYLVEGASILYNFISYNVGDTFKYVLGQDTFSSASQSAFVKQVASDPQLITSFNDFYQTVKSLMGGNSAFGVDKGSTPQGVPFIEALDYVFRSGIDAVQLGNVDKDWKSSPAIDLMYNKIKVGYEDQQYDAINGQQEVNSTQYYGSDLLQPSAELDLVSKYRADPYGIETVRITQQDSAASRSDNDAFMVWIDPAPVSNTPFTYYHPLLAANITGVDPSYYNWKITPKQNLLRGGPYLSSIFYNMKGYQLKLTSYLKNVGVVTIENGISVSESAPVNISDLPKPLFIPEYFEVKQGIVSELIGTLDSNTYADVSFVVNNVTAYAFISNLKADLGKESAQELKLLLTPNNNLKDFVR